MNVIASRFGHKPHMVVVFPLASFAWCSTMPFIYIYVLRHSVRLDHYVSGDQERKERLNIGRKKLCTE